MNQVDFNDLSQNLDTSSLMGCDSSFANIFLYQKKYNTSLQTELSELHGPVLQKKKNHINRFMRTYENHWSFKTERWYTLH